MKDLKEFLKLMSEKFPTDKCKHHFILNENGDLQFILNINENWQTCTLYDDDLNKSFDDFGKEIVEYFRR